MRLCRTGMILLEVLFVFIKGGAVANRFPFCEL